MNEFIGKYYDERLWHWRIIENGKGTCTYIKALWILFAVCLCDTFILNGFKYTWHRSNQCQYNARMFIRFQHHHLFGPIIVCHHSQSGFRVFIVNGIIYCTHFHVIVQQFAIHWQKQWNGIWFVFNCRKVQRAVLHLEMLIKLFGKER